MGIRASPGGCYLLLLLKGAPAELWTVRGGWAVCVDGVCGQCAGDVDGVCGRCVVLWPKGKCHVPMHPCMHHVCTHACAQEAFLKGVIFPIVPSVFNIFC